MAIKRKGGGVKPAKAKNGKAITHLSFAVPLGQVFGAVEPLPEGIKVGIKRPRSSKTDTFIVPKSSVRAFVSGEKGWVITDNPILVNPISISYTLESTANGAVKGQTIEGEEVVILSKEGATSYSTVDE